MATKSSQLKSWQSHFEDKGDIPEELVTITDEVTMAHLPSFTPFPKSLELAEFHSPPTPLTTTTTRPNVFGNLSTRKARAAWIAENGLRV